MARFDVYRNADGPGYLLDLQADFLESLNTRVVAPLLPPSNAPVPAKTLNPRFRVGDDEVIMVIQYLAAVPTSSLGQPIANLARHHDEIVDAVDLLMQGF
ncbi:CcdB family protein [Azospirillum sp. SYSU D00513]|uniref:CcdB family protein n=1 Tax=Azospirillum sp. SYSU D00513 TaxID=2812561 RepID=UPI001A95860D|nr:CcdB family protein [Azospirillum sp. SYSU D00513]